MTEQTHRAIGMTATTAAPGPESFEERQVPTPAPTGHDLLVEVHAISMNPIDTKQRRSVDPNGFRVLGYDAAGVVTAAGQSVDGFAVGDEVMFSGQLNRDGSNQQQQLVDSRLVARAPRGLSWAERASLPLVSITAYECLMVSLGLTAESRGTLLVNNATGGVGSAMLQLADALLPNVTVIATASTDERAAFVTDLGAEHVVNHRGDLAEQVLAIAPNGVDWVFSSKSEGMGPVFAQLLRPRGHIVAIDEISELTDLMALKQKSITWHWESMFTRPLFQDDADKAEQGRLLTHVTELVESGRMRPVVSEVLSPISVDTLAQAHQRSETGSTLGKVALNGWQ